jgi:hypothetical protein
LIGLRQNYAGLSEPLSVQPNPPDFAPRQDPVEHVPTSHRVPRMVASIWSSRLASITRLPPQRTRRRIER